MSNQLVETIRQQLLDLGVKDTTKFLPDDSAVTAAAIELLMINEEPGIPTLDGVDFWLATKEDCSFTQADAQTCIEVYQQLYHNPTFVHEVLQPLGQISQQTLRNQDIIWDS